MTLDTEALSALRRDADEQNRQRYRTRAGRRKLRLLLVGGAAAVVLALAWLLRGNPRELEVAVVEPPDAAGLAVLNASGYITARRLATVSSKVTGRVAELLFEEGAAVKEHQVLARLDAATVHAQYQVALRESDAAAKALAEIEVRLADAVRERDRARALRPRNLVSQSALDRAEAEAAALAARLDAARAGFSVAQAAVGLRRQDLDDLVIRAPFDGIIVSKDAQPGEMVSPISAGGGFTRTGIATIVDLDSREIEVDVNEAYINRVRDGQRVVAVLDAYPDWTIPARVIAIVPTADRQKATVRVRIALERLDPRILPDMGVKVRFYDDVREQPAMLGLVPAAAVVEAGGQVHLWRLRGDRVERIAVRVADERSGMRPVLAGVQSGDTIVVGPPADLEDGERVATRAAD